MVEITLKNGSKFQISEMNFKGKLIDSNGAKPGGITTFPFTESDVNKLNAQVPSPKTQRNPPRTGNPTLASRQRNPAKLNRLNDVRA